MWFVSQNALLRLKKCMGQTTQLGSSLNLLLLMATRNPANSPVDMEVYPIIYSFFFFIPPVVGLGISEPSTWSNYSDLTRPHPKWWFSKGNPLISGKPRLVKYYNLARSTVRRLQSQPWGLLIFYWDRWCFWVTWIPYFAVQLDEYLTIPKTLFGVTHRIHVWYPPGNKHIPPKMAFWRWCSFFPRCGYVNSMVPCMVYVPTP